MSSNTPSRWRKRLNLLVILLLLLSVFAGASTASANDNRQAPPFSQDWANTALITTDDDWASVPGIVGYRGDALTGATGADPQTIVADGSATPIDVNANQTNPNTFTTGGVTEFHIADPVVALSGSGTADAPHIVIYLDTTGLSSIGVAYNLRDIDGSTDDTNQQVALQYRVGNSGNFTNIPAGYVADATTGPSLATLVTPVSVTLPAAADNQSDVQVRIITTNAPSNDEWVGVDDIVITGTPVVGDNAPAVDSTIPTNGAVSVAVNTNITINFSEPVTVTGGAFTLECPAGTPVAFANTTGSGPATAFVLDPASDLPASTTCTVTVVASEVSDADADDPPDNLAADYSWSFTTVAPVVASPLVINEIDYDQPGTDTAEFVEIRNNDSVAVNLDLYSIIMLNGGSGGAIYRTIDLPSVNLAAGDYYVVCAAATVANCDLDASPDTDLIQNGAPDAVALRFNTTIIDAVSYEGDTAGATEGSGAGLADTGALANESISRCPDGVDTNQNNVDFSLHLSTPGATNICVAVDPAPTVSITVPANGATSMAPAVDIEITFSEPVDVAGSWFSISCANSGAHTATVSGGPTTFTLNPDVDFSPNELCSVTVTGSLVSDQDTDDPLDTMAADFSFSFTTGVVQICGDPYTSIYTIQGSGTSLPAPGDVTTEGVVVGDFEGGSGLGGFYLQDPTGDGDSATSDGIFVYTGNADTVSVGDLVRVTGFARERFSQTSINGANIDNAAVPPANIVSCGAGIQPAPADVTMPFPNATYLERFEGMRVNFPQTLSIAEYFNYARFGEIVLAHADGIPELAGQDRQYTPTSIVAPGAPANALLAQYELRQITLDDGLSIQNPSTLRHPNGSPFSVSNLFRGGDTLQNVVGVLGFDFSIYRIQPTAAATYTAANPRPAEPEDIGGRITVGAFNTLNYFLTLDGIDDDSGTNNPADDICGGNANLECRGADASQPLEFGRQRDKLLQAIVGLDADALGLNELENTPNVEPLADIVAGLNAILGPDTYGYIDTGTIGTDAIKVGIIYKTAVLSPTDSFAILDSSVDPRFIDTRSRPSLAQTFEEVGTGARFTIAVNHLKSKGSACSGDPDAGDGQGNCNGTRELAAQALVDWLATDPTGSGDPDFLILGDLNSYAQEDPITAIRAGADDTPSTSDDWTNLIAAEQGTFAYSYVFDGLLGYLDHALGNASITPQVTGAADWHINADEASIFDYDTSFKPAAQEAIYEVNAYRTADHDPVLVGLNLTVPNSAPVANDDNYSVAEDAVLNVPAPGVLGNDDDDNDDTLTAALVSGPSHGTLTFAIDGSFIYTPTVNFFGADSFTYKANDGTVDSNVATVTITVNSVNDLPTIALAAGGACLADFRGQANLVVGDLETAAGSLTLSGSSSNTTLVPNANITFGGSGATRTVTISTASGQSGSAIVTILVNDGSNTSPITIQVLAGTSNNNTLTGGSGPDIIFGGNAQDTLTGHGGIDLLCGGQGDDKLYGKAGDDTLDGGSGQDWLDGGDDNDTLRGGQGDDKLYGRAGDDTLDGGQGQDCMEGGTGADTLLGGQGDDELKGGDDNDTLYGGQNNDRLYGEQGDDQMYGEQGDDRMTGGTGADHFDGGPNNDIAFDFNAGQGDTKVNIP